MMKKKLIVVTVLIILSAISVPSSGAYAWITSPPQEADQAEVPIELTKEEYFRDAEQFYKSHPDLVITVDLADPKGIDPSLLPQDLQTNFKAMADSGIRIVAYREAVHVDIKNGKPSGLAVPYPSPNTGITCATNSGSRDITTSQVFGSVEQFARTIALRYDWYSRCQSGVNCFGWEIEKQYMWWKRSSSSWNVKNGSMKTYIEAENYCTTYSAILNHGSTTIQPAWSGNQTSIYSISGFPDRAYVPWPSGYSYTQGDIYEGTTLRYNGVRNYQFWPRY